MGKVELHAAVKKTWKTVRMAMPIVFGVLMLTSLINPLIQRYYPELFTGNYLLDPLVGTLVGSVSSGIPLISYPIGSELLHGGVTLLAVTAFLFSWQAVGLVMFPLEASLLGRRFALLRNSLNFLASFVVATLTVLTLNILR